MDYQVEWSTIAAANFGYNHYRHRTFVMAYKKNTKLAETGVSLFKIVSKYANSSPGSRYPKPIDMSEAQADYTRVEDTRAIKLRTKRLNALGNSVVNDIVFAILDSLAKIELGEHKAKLSSINQIDF
ncbi:DNA cytosine methyltransferase [Shewanella sp. HL-SH8]|uniref:DNA cytosine methyltransferase n=1 Tax=Shewanella sp. HL-SH8 TaxID=3436242 RepID=UPI003EB6F67C